MNLPGCIFVIDVNAGTFKKGKQIVKNEIFLPAKEICRRYFISELTIRRRAQRGDLHPVRHGRIVRYPLSEVQALWGQNLDESKGSGAK